jgi:acyl-coenzyme A thioesterase PaaI-like protein
MERIQAIFQGDRLIQDFDITLVEAREGYAKVSVVVAERFLNAHRIGHGVLFAAADAAFALAVNAAATPSASSGVQRLPAAANRPCRRGPSFTGQSLVCELVVTAGDGRVLAKGQATALPVTPAALVRPATTERTASG